MVGGGYVTIVLLDSVAVSLKSPLSSKTTKKNFLELFMIGVHVVHSDWLGLTAEPLHSEVKTEDVLNRFREITTIPLR